jgi:hypothetical protein
MNDAVSLILRMAILRADVTGTQSSFSQGQPR